MRQIGHDRSMKSRLSVAPISYLLTLIFCVSFFMSYDVFANIQITSISRASNYSLGSGTETPVIYGGVAGDGLANACASPSTTSTCNNCVLNTVAPQACNLERIHPDLWLRIEFKVTGDLTGYVFLGYDNSGTATAFDYSAGEYTKTTTQLSKDSTGYVEVKWSAICDAVYGDSTCSFSSTLNDGEMNIYISVESSATFAEASRTTALINILSPIGDGTGDVPDELDSAAVNGAGIYQFVAYPGDRKVYISPDDGDTAIVNTCPTEFKFIRVFYSAIDLDNASYGSDYKDLKAGTNCEQDEEWVVDGLENGVSYFFRTSIVDIAKNNVFLVSKAEILSQQAACVPPANANDVACNYIATPQEVVGLLPEDFNCFISTAAYGSGFASKVQTLRKFRNQFLLPSQLGKKFVATYYKYGPRAAKYISSRPNVRAATRIALFPFWAFAWMSLHYGIFGALIAIVSVIGLSVFQLRRYQLQKIKNSRLGPR